MIVFQEGTTNEDTRDWTIKEFESWALTDAETKQRVKKAASMQKRMAIGMIQTLAKNMAPYSALGRIAYDRAEKIVDKILKEQNSRQMKEVSLANTVAELKKALNKKVIQDITYSHSTFRCWMQMDSGVFTFDSNEITVQNGKSTFSMDSKTVKSISIQYVDWKKKTEIHIYTKYDSQLWFYADMS